MNNSNEIEILKEDYILKRLVYINSANHGYSEIILNYHMALFGRNNAGKTASLAGTKLLLYPEIDFHHCEERFKFEGKEGLYTMDQSYEFYFPDARSFIVLEVENPEGIFCMILFKMANYGYGRFFVPLPYDDVRQIFWNLDSKIFADDLSVQMISRFIKINNGIQVTNAKEISHLMFSSFRDDKSKKRFCVLPLKDGGKDSIEAFKNIYQLAFETGKTETKALSKALATLLEMGRSRDEERLDANLKKLADEHTQLINKREWLQKLSNSKQLFNDIVSDSEKIKNKFIKYSKKFNAIETATILAKEKYTPLIKENNENLDKYEEIKNNLNKNIREKHDEIQKIQGWLSAKEDVLKKSEESLEKAKSVSALYGKMLDKSIVEELSEDLEKNKKILIDYKEEDGVKSILEKNVFNKNRLIKKVKQLNDLIDSSEITIMHQLNDVKKSNILFSLNEKLSSVSVELNEQHKSIISDFTELFDQDGAGCLTFLDQSILDVSYKDFSNEEQVAAWKREEIKSRKRIKVLSDDIGKQQDALKHDNVEELIMETTENIRKISEQIAMVSSINRLTEDIKLLKNELEQKEINRSSLEVDVLELKTNLSKVSGEWNVINQSLEELKIKNTCYGKIEDDLNKARALCVPDKDELDLTEEEDLTESVSYDIWKIASELSSERNKFYNQLRLLLVQLPHPDVDNNKNHDDVIDAERAVQAYALSYSTLDYDLAQHLNEIKSHNQYVSNQLNELKEAKLLLVNFINDINKELNDKRVSNLSEIKLHLEMNKRFESLLATLEKHDIQDDSLLDDQFYISLANFIERYFDKKTRRLKMFDLIDSITYHYTLAETGETVTKSQSGGTTTTITAFVLSVLLNRIKPAYVSLRMPIIVDEISTLDFENTEAAIKQIADHGFSIFCATPNFSAFLSEMVGRWVMINREKVKEPLVSKCHTSILPNHVESFGEI